MKICENETVAEAIEITKAIFFKDIGDVNERCQWCRRKLQERLDRIEAAHKREIAEKDADIAGRDALIKELEDAASENMKSGCGHCDLRDACQEGEDGMVVPCNQVIKLREAIKNARETIGGVE